MYKRFNRIQDILLSPDDGRTGVEGVAELTRDGILDALNDDDDIDDAEPIKLDEDKKKAPDKEAKEEDKEDDSREEADKDAEGDESDESDELKDIEDELEGPTDEQLELTTPVRRREILKKYPNLFKDFPYLEKAYYREQQFTEILPTIDDAREAVSKAETLDKFDKDITDGDISKVLTAAKENQRGFNKLVDNYLAVLGNIDQKAYHHVIGGILKDVIVSMVEEAKESNNDDLRTAAQILNQFAFMSSKFTPKTRWSGDDDKPDNKENSESEQLKHERAEFVKQRFETARNGLNSKVNNSIRSTIEQNIDPKDSMGSYVKKAATTEAFNQVVELIGSDKRFKVLLDKLWEGAFKSNFSEDSLKKIRSACLTKAKTLLPAVIKQARNEALRGIGKRVRDDSGEHEERESRRDSGEGKKRVGEPQTRTPSNRITKPGDIPKGMTSLDYLMQD